MMTTKTDALKPEAKTTTTDEAIFSESARFDQLQISDRLRKALAKRGFEQPTDIQGTLIPVALTGRDVIGQAKTGTGKTGAFGIPLFELVTPGEGHQALILVPTRELALQVTRELNAFGQFLDVRVAAVYGGERKHKQLERLERGAEIIVGTPGRVMDFQGSGELSFEALRHVVLDEVDRMLDIGFRDDIRHILNQIRQPHQTIFVSATISPEIEQLARTFMKDPEKIVSVSGSLTVSQVDQSHVLVEKWDKKRLLLHLLEHEDPALTLVFCGTKREVDYLTEYLQKHDVDAHAIHGDMYQRKRDRVMKRFREGKLSVLVASDVAARGLDVQGVSHVVNYDMPHDPEVYVHRIGRTARLGQDGIAWSFVTPGEGHLLTEIEMLINREVPRQKYDDFKPGPIPAKVRAERAKREADTEAERVRKNRYAPEKITDKDAKDATRFPGGIVPSGMPRSRMGGRARGRGR